MKKGVKKYTLQLVDDDDLRYWELFDQDLNSLGKVAKMDEIEGSYLFSHGRAYKISEYKLSTNSSGYYRLRTFINKKMVRYFIHRLIGKYFLGNIDGMTVHHKTFDKSKNEDFNLEILTFLENLGKNNERNQPVTENEAGF